MFAQNLLDGCRCSLEFLRARERTRRIGFTVPARLEEISAAAASDTPHLREASEVPSPET